MTTTEAATGRTLRVENLTRVEGEGGLFVRTAGGEVREVRVDIFEPPRLFEGFLRGRHVEELPDITARICGICPVAYQMTSVQAVESGLGVKVTEEIRTIRRLMYAGEYIESHALHVWLLNAPDVLGYESAIAMAADHRGLVEGALRLKKTGNDLLDLLGGRASHPVSVRVGGFHRLPRKRDLLAVRDDLLRALDLSLETVAVVTKFELPRFERDCEMVALSSVDEYAILEGRVASTRGLDIRADEYERAFVEYQVPHSTALHSRIVRPRPEPAPERASQSSTVSYLVGPLARLALNRDRLMPQAQALAAECGVAWPSRNPFHGIVARAIELVHFCEESVEIIDRYAEPPAASVPVAMRAGEGSFATEAPRGILYHRYRWNESGIIEEAKIVPPTAQNLARMEDDLRLLVPPLLDLDDAAVAARCEQLVRTYDPCISCSTHFLRLRIERD